MNYQVLERHPDEDLIQAPPEERAPLFPRVEYGFTRTACACAACVACCTKGSGRLMPADLPRLMGSAEPFTWARGHLLASRGATVALAGQVFRVPSLVLARRSDGACIYLTTDKRCAVWEKAPHGCAFFDTHMDKAEGDRRSTPSLNELCVLWRDAAQAWAEGKKAALYAELWVDLWDRKLRAEDGK